MQPPWKKVSLFSSNPPQKIRSCQGLPPFCKFAARFKKQERGCRLFPVPSFLISFCVKVGMHMCWSLSLITFQALQLHDFSLQFSSLHTWQVYINWKIWKGLLLKICDLNTKYLRLKSPKYKAKLKLQKNYVI